MSNLPPGCNPYGPKQQVEQHCSNEACGHKWDAAMSSEFGGMFYENDDEANCPKCGAESEEAQWPVTNKKERSDGKEA